MGALGNPKTGGRKRGSRNKSSLSILEKAQKLNIDPLEILLCFAAGDWKSLGYESEKTIVRSKDVENEQYVIEPSTRMRAAAEACQYLYPKLKSIDNRISSSDGSEAKLIISLPQNGFEGKEV